MLICIHLGSVSAVGETGVMVKLWSSMYLFVCLFVCLFIIHSVNPYMVKTTGYRICHYKLH